MDDASMSAAVELLLNISRESISSGNANDALAAIIQAITISHPQGEGAVVNILEEAKRRNELESEQQLRDDTIHALERARQISRQLLQEETILAENGLQTILKDAFEDGSSVVCTKCGSLVPAARSEAHSKYWCEFATDCESDVEND
mmetsp:Transcript_28651/g.48360  ORF Transcript_28651/g.48360 Transcript_28651/m.48360 type:complete len:147 (-) Transcript_28651:210-650(-)|eukprot:CAMPEP_0114423462 /NCGR_PEP_ID=MMETSP0103-20121206/6161_1 /TAXON_ID=37642 ORGANISM="Paraphysomonas imperforata, Strain PA2" /NCGR_SAMPLE_ID=MMETSP0103 /ASSEMBLY_ACC=CAM_ASM_000201 /LENGTH=146 /DNA_ID=CAMNT_0001592125 /DNA_START=153 /DNA_END=593 /DNA_ORIENTATION=+